MNPDEQAPSSAASHAELDALTHGAFSASQSQERAQLLKAWLDEQPALTDLVRVHREMSSRDKGAAKVLKEAIDHLKREHHQEALVTEWSNKAQQVLSQHPFVMGDALAWIRDAAKAGAPLSKEPLSQLKASLADRIKSVEDLQQQCMVQRESVHLLMQRMDNLSARDWPDASAALTGLHQDVHRAQDALRELTTHADWPHVDLKYPTWIEQSQASLQAAWTAFEAAATLAQAAQADAQAPLPGVAAWDESLRAQREGRPARAAAPKAETPVAAAAAEPPVKPEETPEQIALRQAVHAERQALLEQALALTHWVADEASAASPVQGAEAVEVAEARPEPAAEAAAETPAESEAEASPEPAAAEATAETPAESEAVGVPSPAAQASAPAGHWEAALPVRQLQQQLRQLRQSWKDLDHKAPVHHGLWRKFDQACNRAYPFVKEWVDGVREQNQSHQAQREALIAQVQAWTQALPEQPDWKQVQRDLQQFNDQWRHGGHLSEKAFQQIQPAWKAAIKAAEAPWHAAIKANIAQRKALIEQAQALGAQSPLPVAEIKALQQTWQTVSQQVPIERRLSQKLWESFRQPLDEAFARSPKPTRGAPRSGGVTTSAPLNAHEQQVMAAIQALDDAIATRDAARIQNAREALQVALNPPAASAPSSLTEVPAQTAGDAIAEGASETAGVKPATAPPKPLIAVRGDDRHKVVRAEAPGAGARGQGARPGKPMGRGPGSRDAGREFGRDERAPRGPRLSDIVFHAQRQVQEKADKALRQLSAQAHGEHLHELMQAWKQRDAQAVPAAKLLGKSLTASQCQAWQAAVAAAPQEALTTQWVRLDMAAGLSTPAHEQDARRAYQLQLLTQRQAPSPEQTWAEDVAKLLASEHTEVGERRLQEALKVLLSRR